MDDQLKPTEKSNIPIADSEQEAEVRANKVFDISEDLDIKPIADPDQEIPKTPGSIPTTEQPKTELQNEIGKLNIEAAIYRASKTPKAEIPKPIVPKPISLGEDGNKITEPPKPVEEKGNFVQKPIRTYEGDIAEFMSRRKTSVADMAIAENKRQGEGETIGNEELADQSKSASHIGKKLTMLILSLVLIGAGSIGSYYLYKESPLSPRAPAATISSEPVSLVTADYHVTVSIDGSRSYQVIDRVKMELLGQQAPKTIKEISFIKAVNGTQTAVTGPEMMSFMDIPVPDELARTITDDWMFGIYSDDRGERSVFVVATTNYFQNAFAGMLAWENVMADDLRQYLVSSNIYGVANVPVVNEPSMASSTDAISMKTLVPETAAGSSTLSESSDYNSGYDTLKGRFVDRIVGNKDVRLFVTDDGKTLFLYSFVNNDTIVLAGSEKALAEILSRLEKQAFTR